MWKHSVKSHATHIYFIQMVISMFITKDIAYVVQCPFRDGIEKAAVFQP